MLTFVGVGFGIFNSSTALDIGLLFTRVGVVEIRGMSFLCGLIVYSINVFFNGRNIGKTIRRSQKRDVLCAF